MNSNYTILLLEDEPLILMDLEFAAEDHGCKAYSSTSPQDALAQLANCGDEIDVAILDVSLGNGKTCFPVAKELDRLGIPFILHSADLDRHDERIRELDAERIAKPAPSGRVVEIALSKVGPGAGEGMQLAAE